MMEKSGRRRSRIRGSLVLPKDAELASASLETPQDVDPNRVGEEWLGPNQAVQRLRDAKQAQRHLIDAQRQMTMQAQVGFCFHSQGISDLL